MANIILRTSHDLLFTSYLMITRDGWILAHEYVNVDRFITSDHDASRTVSHGTHEVRLLTCAVGYYYCLGSVSDRASRNERIRFVIISYISDATSP